MPGWAAKASGLVLAGLLAGGAAMNPAFDAPPLEGTTWVLAALPGVHLAKGATATLRFQDGRAQGTDGCNRFSGPYSVAGASIALPGPMAGTQMACAPSVQAQATAFLTALRGAHAYRVAGGRLELTGANGTLLATLAAQSQALAGTSWVVTGINNGKQAVASVLAGSKVTLSFARDGRAMGSAGCNRFVAAYTAEGGRVHFGTAGVTRMTCATPPGVMEQEQAFVAALGTVATARVEGNRLDLRTADGALAISATREAAE